MDILVPLIVLHVMTQILLAIAHHAKNQRL
jgi:hypothetical protein